MGSKLFSVSLFWAYIAAIRLGCEASISNCTFLLPSTDSPERCEQFNLTNLAAIGPVNAAGTSPNAYIFSVCQNVPRSSLPLVCAAKASAPAYQYTVDSCYIAGNISSIRVYSVDPTNSSAGIRLAYNGGEGTYNNYWSRALIIDFKCNPTAGVGRPQYVFEYPTYTYKVRWPTSFACPLKTTNSSCSLPQYAPTWDSLRFRPRPSWYDDVKFGIFVHWGVFSVPAYLSEWYWKRLMLGDAPYVEFHNRVYGCSGVMPDTYPCTGPNFTYPEFAPMFRAELWDPDSWAELFRNSGAKCKFMPDNTAHQRQGFFNSIHMQMVAYLTNKCISNMFWM